ncbi:MAG: hypothetical protein KAT11_00640, partial [Phycisphaerae bacterium]|nr:hypothetical protein [Phycisphaerae bacterium]
MNPRKGNSLDEAASDESTLVRIEVRRSLSGKRLDKYLHGRLAKFSRTALQRLIKDGNVHVDGRAVKPS